MADYKTFVAWRYLLVNPTRVSWRVTGLVGGGILVQLAFLLLIGLDLYDPTQTGVLQAIQIAACALTWVVWFVFVLRHSKPALVAYVALNVIGALALLASYLIRHD